MATQPAIPVAPAQADAKHQVHPIANAGIVLAAPYLPRLFELLGLVHDGAFVNTATAERAALLLQLAVTGEARAAESALPLNKLLCGLPLDWPVPTELEPTAAERERVEGMLQAIIGHWKAIGQTSLAGLRLNFLQRPGQLEYGTESCKLQVQRQSLDLLIERLPWGFSTIRYPWISQVLHVRWP